MELTSSQERGNGVDKNEELCGTSADAVSINAVQNNGKWYIDLKYMPIFTSKKLNDKLINNAETMPDKISSKAPRNKQHGYRL